MRSLNVVIPTGISLLIVGIAAAGFFDLSGGWRLSMRLTLDESLGDGVECVYSGSTEVTQDGTSLSGDASYVLQQGSDPCPAEVLASYTAVLTPSSVEMGALMGPLGTATFDGFFSLPTGDPGLGIGGDVTVTGGPFAGASGFWNASRGSGGSNVIPTLDTVGVAVLALALLFVGLGRLRR